MIQAETALHSSVAGLKRAPVFGPDYSEEIVLKDGRRARLEVLRPAHTAELLAGFARLSPRSRYLRYFGAKPRLTAQDLARLFASDSRGHYAIGVAVENDGEWEGAAAGHFAPAADDTARVELAITVIDDYQRAGLGRLLLERLRDAAIERGFRGLHAEVLAENRGMLRLLSAFAPDLVARSQGTSISIDIAL